MKLRQITASAYELNVNVRQCPELDVSEFYAKYYQI
jgi:hypothetical protein